MRCTLQSPTCVCGSFVNAMTCKSSPSTLTRCPCRWPAVGGVSWPLLPPSRRRRSPRPHPAGSYGCWWTWRRWPEGGAAGPLYSWRNLSWRPEKERRRSEEEDKAKERKIKERSGELAWAKAVWKRKKWRRESERRWGRKRDEAWEGRGER